MRWPALCLSDAHPNVFLHPAHSNDLLGIKDTIKSAIDPTAAVGATSRAEQLDSGSYSGYLAQEHVINYRYHHDAPSFGLINQSAEPSSPGKARFRVSQKMLLTASHSGPLIDPSLSVQANHLSSSPEYDVQTFLRWTTTPDPSTNPCTCSDEAFSVICPQLRAHLYSTSIPLPQSDLDACTCPEEYGLTSAARTCVCVATHLHNMVSKLLTLTSPG